MGIKDFLRKLSERKERLKEMETEYRLQKMVEQKQKSSNERELERFLEEKRQEQIKNNLERFRKQRQKEWFSSNMFKQDDITRNDFDILKGKKIFNMRGNMLNGGNMFLK